MNDRDLSDMRDSRQDLLAALQCSTTTPTKAGATSKVELFLAHLAEEGFRPRVDDDGDVVFKCEGMRLVLVCDEDDKAFFRLMLPAFWEIESQEEGFRALRAINTINARFKVIKLLIVRDHVWVSVEQLFDPMESSKSVLARFMRLILQSISEFRDEMNLLEAEDA